MPDFIEKLKKSSSRQTSPTKSIKNKTGGSDAGVEAGSEAGNTGFQQILNGVKGDEAERRLDKILNDINKLSGMLVKKRLLEDLESYRNKVSEFLRVYMDEVLDVKYAAGRRGFSRRKQVLVVKKVNIELEELSKMVLGGAKDFELVREFDTIQGLLMDLYR